MIFPCEIRTCFMLLKRLMSQMSLIKATTNLSVSYRMYLMFHSLLCGTDVFSLNVHSVHYFLTLTPDPAVVCVKIKVSHLFLLNISLSH